MSVLAWVDPPAPQPKAAKAKLGVAYEIPDFGTPTLGEIPDVRWAHDMGTHNLHKGAITRALKQWLEDHPSYWVLVGTYGTEEDHKARTSGWRTSSLYDLGILHALRAGNVYAHSERELGGVTVHESLQAALDGGNGALEAIITLPKLTKDPFGWTEAELTSAVAVARDWLYPMEELAA